MALTNVDLYRIDGTVGSLANVATAAINGGQIAGTRNRLINGCTCIDQRNSGASQTFTAAAALAYSVDRWYGYCTGANVTGQRVTGAVANTFRYRFTGAASVTAIGFGQRIEAQNCADLAGTTATLSVDLADSLLTSVTWTAYYATTADTFGTLASPTRTQIATGTFTVNSTVSRYNTQIAIPAAATTGIEIVFTVGAQISGTWTIGNVQLEPGSTATPFENLNQGQHLALCQRYFQLAGNGAFGAAETTSIIAFTEKFVVSMRAIPTLAWKSGATARWRATPAGPGTADVANGNSASLANMAASPDGLWGQQGAFGVAFTINAVCTSRNNSTLDSAFITVSAEL